MSNNIIVAVIVGALLPTIFFIWKYSNTLKAKIFVMTIKKEDHDSLDIDNLVRFVVFLVLIIPVFVIVYFISVLVDG